MKKINYYMESAKDRPFCISFVGGDPSLRYEMAQKLVDKMGFEMIRVTPPFGDFTEDVKSKCSELLKKVRKDDEDILMRRFLRLFRKSGKHIVVPDLSDEYDISVMSFFGKIIAIDTEEKFFCDLRINTREEDACEKLKKFLNLQCVFRGYCSF